MNGILSLDESLEEKAYIFEIVAALSSVEIVVLSLFQKKQGSKPFDQREPITIKELSEEIALDSNLTQQICVGLSGKGLLHDYGLGRFDYKGPVNFIMTDYVNLIGRYLFSSEI